MKEERLKNYLFIFCLLAGLITIGLIIAIGKESCNTEETNWAYPGQIGDFFGGVVGTLVAAVGFILIYLSFVSQTKSQEKQEKQFNKSQIESRFFELIKLHKENLNDIVYTPKKGQVLIGRKAVDFIYEQIEQCYKELQPFFESNDAEDIYNKDFLKDIQCYSNIRPNFCLINLAQIDIAYSIVFFGTSHNDLTAWSRLMSKYYEPGFLWLIARFIRLKPSSKNLTNKWEIILNSKLTYKKLKEIFILLDEYKTSDYTPTLDEILTPEEPYFRAFRELENVNKLNRFYGGHQYKLGHYFRHLFQTVKYIDEKEILTYDEKYDYIKTLRAQLSTVEQYVFFFNSVSFMGRAWEFEKIVDSKFNNSNSVNKWLISKYNLIKNIPDLYPFEDVLLINDYYPEIDFEFEEPSKTRKAISEQYWEK